MNSTRRLLFVHAHPDDETLSTGGTIAKYAAEGVEVSVVTCTLGEDGEIIPSELGQLGYEFDDQLGGYRAAELERACEILGVTEHYYLGGIGRWRDSGMEGARDQPHPRALTNGAFQEQLSQLVEILEKVQPQVVVTYDAFGGYGHPDHIRAHQLTMAAAPTVSSVARIFHAVRSSNMLEQALEPLKQMPELPFDHPGPDDLPAVPDSNINSSIILGQHRETLIKALRAHKTQVSVWPEPEFSQSDLKPVCFALSDKLVQPVPEREYYVLAYGSARGIEFDLFGGL